MPMVSELMRGARPILLLGVVMVVAIAGAGLSLPSSATADPSTLRVCADPNNLPFSNAAGQGFENKIADLVAKALKQRVAYLWSVQNRNFLRDTLEAGRCDVVMGVPTDMKTIATTEPYYWTSYVFVSRSDRHLDVTSIDDKRLKTLKIGVEAVNGDRLATPPARMLASSGVRNLIAYPVTEDNGMVNAGDRIIAAVARGDIDVAAVWGPRAGYFARFAGAKLRIVPITNAEEFSSHKLHFSLFGFQYNISMGVREGNEARRTALDSVIAQKGPEIRAILEGYGVPLISHPQTAAIPADAAAD